MSEFTPYKRCFGRIVIKGQFVRKDRARAWARRNYGADAQEGWDFELVQSAAGKWAAEPGPKYDDPPPAQRAWETAAGMRGYAGSPAEREDRALGLVVGGKCRWNAEGTPIANIDHIEIDDDGDPWFHLSFPGNDKPVRAERSEVLPNT